MSHLSTPITQQIAAQLAHLTGPDVDPLDSLLSESMGTGLSAPEEFSLEGLLKESLQSKRDAESVKTARALLARGGVDPESRKNMTDSIRAWEVKREWTAVASVAMFHRQFCGECDLYHVTFAGYYQRQEHRTTKIQRWVQATKDLRSVPLPKECKYEDSICELCEECAGKAGYPIEGGGEGEEVE